MSTKNRLIKMCDLYLQRMTETQLAMAEAHIESEHGSLNQEMEYYRLRERYKVYSLTVCKLRRILDKDEPVFRDYVGFRKSLNGIRYIYRWPRDGGKNKND